MLNMIFFYNCISCQRLVPLVLLLAINLAKTMVLHLAVVLCDVETSIEAATEDLTVVVVVVIEAVFRIKDGLFLFIILSVLYSCIYISTTKNSHYKLRMNSFLESSTLIRLYHLFKIFLDSSHVNQALFCFLFKT